jgi:16S rRNA (cytosine1402-N4)-methyltransferase
MTRHTPVLLHESVDGLELAPGKIFLDGTLGAAGHSSLVAERFGKAVTIIGLDRDSAALERSKEKLESLNANFHLVEESFRNIDKALQKLGIAEVDAILMDLGISSDQIENSGRGFTFMKDEPLLMTMKEVPLEDDLTAKLILNTFEEETLELILRGFGEERYSRRIAKAIVERRKEKPFETTFDLVETILASIPSSYKDGRINPATRTFQALRIAVNEELTSLEEGLEKGFKALSRNGRFAVITFHSLEDRIVKNFFRDRVKEGSAEFVNKKPIVPGERELEENKRARSAKLRIIRKL